MRSSQALAQPGEQVVSPAVGRRQCGAAGQAIVLAGPPIMVREVVKVLNVKGIGKERIHFDEIAVQ